MRFYFNNCRSFDHAAAYGCDAFYDLYLTGQQANMATNITPGDECIVASAAPNGEVVFGWFTFSQEKTLPIPDDPDTFARVLFGRWIRSETLPKAEAAKAAPYMVFFNINGHFKRPSVIVPKNQ